MLARLPLLLVLWLSMGTSARAQDAGPVAPAAEAGSSDEDGARETVERDAAEPDGSDPDAPEPDAREVAAPEAGLIERADTRGGDLRVGVLLLPTGDLDPSITDALTELLIAAVASHDAPQIIGKEEIQNHLGRDDASMLECMASTTCLAIAGVELGVREMVSGTLGRRDGAWIFVLERVDVRTGDVAGRVFRVVEGELASLIDALAGAVPELYVESVRPGRIVLVATAAGEIALDGEPIGDAEAGVPFRRELVAPGVHQLAVRAPGYEPWEREVEVPEGATLFLDAVLTLAVHHFEVPVLTWTFGAAALLALGGGVTLGVLSGASVDGSATMREVFEFFDAREREAVSANVLFAVSGAFTLAALIPLIVALAEEPAAPAFSLLPRLDLDEGGVRGVALELGGRF